MKEILIREISMEKGLMSRFYQGLNIKEVSVKIKKKEKGFIGLLMGLDLKVFLRMMFLMEKEKSTIVTEMNIKVSLRMEKEMV